MLQGFLFLAILASSGTHRLAGKAKSSFEARLDRSFEALTVIVDAVERAWLSR